MRRGLVTVGYVAAQTVVLLVAGPTGARATVDEARSRAALTDLRMPIIANQGQVDAAVAFYAPTFAGTLFVTRRGELVYALPARAAGDSRGRGAALSGAGWALRETLAGGRAHPVGQGPIPTGISYFLGNDPARWRAGVRAYDRLDLGEVWPGVTVSLSARGGSIEKVFTVRPGTSVDRVRVRVSGATGLAVGPSGALVASTGLGPLAFSAPVAYQDLDGGRRPVAVAYRLEGDGYGFTVGAYDRSAPLVIDPLLQSTYVGGSNVDIPYTLAVHPATGDVYVAGQTSSTNFPHTLGAVLSSYGGAGDAFVARLNGSLTLFIQSTYLGGSGTERIQALAIHPTNGDIYVVGSTSSTNFPRTAGGALPTPGGSGDAYVARLDATLTSIVQATFYGGSGTEFGLAVAIHPVTGDVYLGGETPSANLPATAGSAQPTYAGGSDGFIVRLSSSLVSILQATYLGGSDGDGVNNLAIHAMTGDVYASGGTGSVDFPGTTGGAQASYGGGGDVFVARLASSLTSIVQATYLGGSNSDSQAAPNHGLAIHPITGSVYVGGFTASANFPGTGGGAQASMGGGFVARLTGSLTSLVQATYVNDYVTAVAIHPTTGHVYVAGTTTSASFPAVAGGAQSTFGGSSDGFVSRLTYSLAAVEGLGLSALVNQPTFATGQTLGLSFGVINPGLPVFADFFLGIIRPDGLFEFVTGSGNVVGTLASLAPFASGIPLSTSFAIPLPNLVSHQWTGSEPHGTYVVVVVAFGGGQVLAVASASYSFP
jgi:hypothetical protein